MVAVVSGSGLGLFGSSVAALGGIGASGNATVGRGADRVFVNSANGNLIIQSQDERLSALGLDVSLVRTYNSQGLLDDDNGDNWRLGVHQRLHNLIGTLNGPGSRITKTFGDGREVIYEFDDALDAYIGTDGDGAHDTLTNSGGTWTWTDGSARNTETYDSSGRLTHSRDADGNTVSYVYTGNLLTEITDESGQTTQLVYSGNNLAELRVLSNGQTQTLTRYYYDSADRLQQVVLDLSPADNAVSLVDSDADGLYESVNGQVYVTTYTYDGTSTRVASIAQGDGSSISFTYELIDGQHRVRTFTDAENRTTTLTYSQSTGGFGATHAAADPSALSTTRTQNYGLNPGALTALPGAGTWSGAELLETINGANASTPAIAFDTAGNGYATFVFNGDIYVRRFDAGTSQWSAAVRLDSTTTLSGAPQLAIDRVSGTAVVAWMQTTGVAVSRYDSASGSWSPTELVIATGASTLSSDFFSLSVAGNFTAIAWLQSDGQRQNLRAVVANNGEWGTATLLEDSSHSASLPQVGIDATGSALVTWRQSDGAIERVYYSRWDHASQSFSAALVLDGGSGAIERPLMSFDSEGNAVALWGEPSGLKARHFDAASGTWGSVVSVQSGTIATWDLAVDAQGNALAGWVQADSGTDSAYARRFDAATGTWGAVALLESSSVQVSTAKISVAIAGQNGVVGWLQSNGTADDLYAANLSSGTWSTPQLLDSRTNPAMSQFAAVDMGGNAALVWAQIDSTNARSIWQARYTGPASYAIPAGSSWQSIANALYGVNSVAAGNALQAAMGNPPLMAGAQLSGWPVMLNVTSTVPAYYTVQTGDTWSSITQAIYGTDAVDAVNALQASLGNPTLAAGVELTVPAVLSHGGTGSAGYLQTDVQDSLGLVTRYLQDEAGRLAAVLSPAVNGTRIETRYAYDADGNLRSITQDPNGLSRVTTFEYDANGNVTLTRDGLGNTIARTYDGNSNRLLTETRYLVRDPDGAGGGQPSEPMTTRYVYDPESHLRFVISPEGRVTEHRYDAAGQLTSTRTYAAGRYTGTSVVESDLVSWIGTLDRSYLELMLYAYDFRGNVSSITQHWGTTSAGAPLGTPMITRFVYDQRGQLLETIDPRGEATTGADYRTAYTYDGLGRVLTTNEWISSTTTRTTLNDYDDIGRVTRTTQASGLLTTRSYNRAGELVSVANGTASAQAALGTKTYAYDGAGRLRMQTDPSGVRQFFLYDDAGRQVASVDGDGSLVEFIYNLAGDRIKTIEYAALLPAATRAALVDGSGSPVDIALSSLRAAAGGNAENDRITRHVFDASGSLVYTIDPSGAVVEHRYDGAGNLTDVIQYATRLTTPRAVDEVLPVAISVTTHADDRRTRYFYDGDGLRIGQLDAEGYLSEAVYNGAGRVIRETRYANQSTVGLRATGTFAALKTSVGVDDETAIDPERDQITSYFYDALGRQTGVLDAEGYFTESKYDMASNVSKRIRFDQALAYRVNVDLLRSAVLATSIRDTTTYTYDGEGRLLSEVHSRGTETQTAEATSTYSYDVMGNLLSTTWAAGTTQARTVEARYDPLGRLVQELSAEGRQRITSGMSQSQIDEIWNRWAVTYAYDTAGRRVSATRSPLDDSSGAPRLEVTHYYYDEDGRLRFEINSDGERKEYRYNALGQLSAEVGYADRLTSSQMTGLAGGLLTPALLTMFTGNTAPTRDSLTSYQYSLTGKVSSVRTAVTTSTAADRLMTYTYNAFGENDVKIEAIDATRTLRTDYTYDKRGQLALTRWDNVTGGLNTSEVRTYDAFGRLRTVTDARSNVSSFEYDRLGRQIATVDAAFSRIVTTYDAFARVLAVHDALDNVTSYSYDDVNRRMTVTTPLGIAVVTEFTVHGQTLSVVAAGRTTQYSYDRDGRLTNVSDNLGSIESRTYDRSGRQIAATDARNVVTRFEYDAANRVLKRIQDNAGLQLTTTYTYDGLGRVTRVDEPGGRRTDTTYNRDGSIEQISVDPATLNLRTRYTYDRAGRAVTVTEGNGSSNPRVTEYRYDALGRRTHEIVDPGAGTNPATGRAYLNLVTQYKYDANGNVTRRIVGDGPSIHSTWYVYDAKNRLTHTIDALGGITRTVYDANDRITETRRYANGLSAGAMSTLAGTDAPTAAQVAVGNDALDAVTRSFYDRDGRERFTIDALGTVTERTFDANRKVTRTRVIASPQLTGTYADATAVSLALGAAAGTVATEDRISWTVYDLRGLAAFSIDAKGAVVQYLHDAAGNVVQRRQFIALRSTSGAFDLASLESWASSQASDGRNRTTRYWYDALNRLRFTLDAQNYLVEQRYNDAGRAEVSIVYTVPATIPVNATLAHLVNGSNGVGIPLDASRDRTTTTLYDAAGRISRVTDNWDNQHYEEYTYDALGNKLSYRNKSGSVWNYTYDANGRLLEEISPQVAVTTITDAGSTLNSNSDVPARIVTRMTYDMLGNVVTRIEGIRRDGNGNDSMTGARTTGYVYDALGRQVRVNFPSLHVYNATAGDTQLGNGAAVSRTETLVAIYTETAYDSLGNVFRNRDVAGNLSFKVYDALGRVTHEVDAENHVTGYTYDVFGNERTVTRYANPLASALPSNGTRLRASDLTLATNTSADRTIVKAYDNLNRVISVTQPAAFHYLPASGIQSAGARYAQSSAQTITEYNAFGEVARIRQLLAPGSYADTYFYYDRMGRKTAELGPLKHLTTFEYDESGDLKRKVEYARPVTGTVTFDSYGTVVATTRLNAPGAAQGYDRETTYVYDRLNRLVRETRVGIEYTDASQADLDPEYADQVTTYGYDAVGNQTRVSKLNMRNGANLVTVSTFIYYDALGRVTAIAEAARDRGDGTQLTPLTLMRRDAYGNLVEEIQFAGTATNVTETGYSLPMANTNAVTGDRITRMLLDAHNNVIRTEDGAGIDRFASYNHRGQVEKEWQQVTNSGSPGVTEYLTTIYKYDRVGRQIEVREAQRYNGSGTTSVRRVTDYNAFGEVIYKGILDGGASSGTQEYFQYDQAGRLWRTNSGDGVTKVYLYDFMGNATAEIRSQTLNLFTAVGSAIAALDLSAANQMRIETRYDALGRAVERREAAYIPTGELDPISGAFAIDSNGSMIRWNQPAAGVIPKFEYRTAGSTDAYRELAIQSLGGGRVGVNVAPLAANITYEYRVRYTNLGENSPFAQATGTFRVDGQNTMSLTTTQDAFDPASEVASLNVAQGQSGSIVWAAPSDTTVVPYFYIKTQGAPESAWQSIYTFRNGTTFQAETQTLMRAGGDFDFKIVYRRTVNNQSVDIATRIGTIDSDGERTVRNGSVTLSSVRNVPQQISPISVPVGTANSVGVVIQESESNPNNGSPPSQWWPGTNRVQLSWASIGAGAVRVELDYVSASWRSWRRVEGMWEDVYHPPQTVNNRVFEFSSGATGALLTWETANQEGAGGVTNIDAARVYKRNSSGQWVLVHSQPNPAPVHGRSARWQGPSVADSFSMEIAPAGTSNYVPLTVVRGSGDDFGVDLANVAATPNGYSYRITYRLGNRIIARQTGTMAVGASSVSFSVTSNATYPYAQILNFTTSGETVSWNRTVENPGSDRVVATYSVYSFSATKTMTGTGPAFTFDFSDVDYPSALVDGSFQVYYYRANETTPYAYGRAYLRVTYTTTTIQPTVTITSQQPDYPSGIVQISRPLNAGNSVLRWTTPAESGADVVFSYEREPGVWSVVPETWTGSEFRVDLGAVPAGTYRYQVTYRRPLAEHAYASTTGQFTLSRSVNVTSVSLTDTTSGPSQIEERHAPRTQQVLDRWGNVIQVTDAANQVTDYRFNAMNQLLETQLPLAALLVTNGGANRNQVVSSSGRAVTRNYYDLHGRLIARQDGNGNVNRTTYNNAGQAIAEIHADGGVKEHTYDAFDQQIQVIDELDYRTRKEYDRAGRLVRVAREFTANAFGATAANVIPAASAAGAIVDQYEYDQAGRRIAETNGEGETTRYFYDLNGNVIRRLSAMERQTTYEYDANDRRTRETDGNGNYQTWTYDYFGRVLTHRDLGGTNFTYTYDSSNNNKYAGLLTSISSTVGQRTTYTYDAAGRVATIVDAPNASEAGAAGLVAVARTTEYGYDLAGRRARETTIVNSLTNQDTRIEYDALGRIAQLYDLRYEATYNYDGAGNRTRIQTSYYDNQLAEQSQDLWYTYDEMNRVLVSQGRNVSGTVAVDLDAATRQGTELSYDLAGQRKTAMTYDKQVFVRERTTPGHPGEPPETFDVYRIIDGITNESYTYDGIGRLTRTGKDGVIITSNTYDKASREITSTQADISASVSERNVSYRSRVTTYDDDGFTLTQTTSKSGTTESVVTFGSASPTDNSGYDAAGILRNYTVQVLSGTPYTTTYNLYYRLADGYQETLQTASSTSGPMSGSTSRTYTQNGELYSFVDSRANSNNRYFANRQGGEVLTVVQGSISNVQSAFQQVLSTTPTTIKSEHFFYANEHQIGSYGQLQDVNGNFKANFDVNYTPVSGKFPLDAPAQVVVQTGDTLRILAMRTFGDGDLWYLIADASGLAQGPDEELVSQVGWSLRVPNEVVSISNTASAFKPYDLADALGDTTPTQPLPPPPKKKGCGVLGQILVIVVAIVVTYFTAGAVSGAFASLGTTGGAVTTAAVSAAAGSAASQGVAIAIGQQDGFSWESVAAAALTGGLLKGAGVSDMFGSNASFGQAALRGAISSSVSQGVNIALGLQDSFNWREIAISGLSSAASAEVAQRAGEAIYGSTGNLGLTGLGMNVSSSLTSALVRQSIGGRMQTSAVLADVFGNALGDSIVDGMAPKPLGITADQWADVDRQLSADVRESQAGIMAGVRADNAVALSPNRNPEFLANLAMPAARYEEPAVRNVPRPAVVANRDPVLDYARTTVGDFWKDGVREDSYSGVDRQFAGAFDELLASPTGTTPRAVPGQQMSDALYLAGPIPVARYDLGIASLTVNGALNFVNGVANAGLNALGALTEPLDRYQGEITSVETGLGPMGAAAVAPTLLLGRVSSAIRAESALNARFLRNGWSALDSAPVTIAQKISFDPSLTTVDRYFGMQAGEIIAADPTARAFYTRLQAQGTDIRFVNDTSLEATGVFDGYRNSVTVNLAEHSTAQEVVSTLIHEGTHQSRFFRGARLGTQYEEYVAFRNEALFNLGRRPTLVERQVIWKDVQHLYPELPSGPVPFGGQR